ncbi:hypothetical protein [Aquimarina mytili]|uniref:Uncharacterized protein n=1 Tax=Aquimarina mytili TaxID=874423 RepID=A0A937A5H6_9FLAO|nr:hypothetical protein [Aquimarina mytili]MBL0685265.1 hypothetical protein [Aquimarina mytili]
MQRFPTIWVWGVLDNRNFLVFDTPNHRFGTQTDENFLSSIHVNYAFKLENHVNSSASTLGEVYRE